MVCSPKKRKQMEEIKNKYVKRTKKDYSDKKHGTIVRATYGYRLL